MTIEELKAEHVQLKNSLTSLVQKIATKTATQADANEIAEALKAHINNEEAIYSTLNDSKQEEVKKISVIFSDLMIEYGEHTINLLKNISSTKKDGLTDMINKISDRITIEETILFPLYDRYK